MTAAAFLPDRASDFVSSLPLHYTYSYCRFVLTPMLQKSTILKTPVQPTNHVKCHGPHTQMNIIINFTKFAARSVTVYHPYYVPRILGSFTPRCCCHLITRFDSVEHVFCFIKYLACKTDVHIHSTVVVLLIYPIFIVYCCVS